MRPDDHGCRRVLRISSAIAVLSMFFRIGIPAERAPQEQAKVSLTPREKRASANSNIRLDVKMILVPITVTDPTDKPVENLAPNVFRVFEDDVEQRIVSLSKEEGPVSVGFIFDASSSMKNRMDRSVAAIQQFLQTNMPGDEYFLVRFADKPTLVTGFTSDPNDILRELAAIQPHGWTALHDAICLGVQQMKSAKNARRALFVLTDGGDNNSRYTESEVKNLVVESDVRVYSVGLFERPQIPGETRRPDRRTGGLGAQPERSSRRHRAHQPRIPQSVHDRLFVQQSAERRQVPEGESRADRVAIPQSAAPLLAARLFRTAGITVGDGTDARFHGVSCRRLA